MRFAYLLHPDTLDEARVARPFRVGLRNSVVAVAAVGIAGLGYLIRFRELGDLTVWWVWGAVVAGAIAVCFGHAYLGAKIGGRRANSIAVLVLLGCLIALIVWMKHAIEAGRGRGE